MMTLFIFLLGCAIYSLLGKVVGACYLVLAFSRVGEVVRLCIAIWCYQVMVFKHML